MDENKSFSNIIFLMLSLISSLILILTCLFQWSLIDAVTPFLMPFVWVFVFIIFVTTLIITLVVYIKSKSWTPLLIQMIALLLFFFVPFTKIIIKLDYTFHKNERQEIINLIKTQTIVPNVSYNDSMIHLPREYQHLSKGGGDIMIENLGQEVFFFTFRGILDNFSGFIYSSFDQKPQEDDFGGDYKEIKRMGKNWYWVSSY